MRLLLFISVVVAGALSEEVESTKDIVQDNWTDFWVVRLSLNLLGYATIFVPGFLLIRHFRRIKYNEIAAPGCLQNFIVLCVFGKEQHVSLEEGNAQKSGTSSTPVKVEEPFSKRAIRLLICVAGLQISYLTWGVLQERIMTIEYGQNGTNIGEFFKDSQFLVFINRILAFIMALIVIMFRSQPPHTAPLYKYSFSSFSNIMSSWCQYEALKFVSFPTQVLAKASKVIPVMLMGKVVSHKTYQYHEYATAIMISVGLSMFLLTSGDVTRHKDSVTTTSGLIMLIGYMLFDSFTSNWQGELFTQYKMSSIQMMAGVNMFSCLLTSVSLIEQGGFIDSAAFMLRHPEFLMDAVILSICSASGQLFIFYTISQYGAVVFVIIMTVRQGFAILLSCIIYGHPLTSVGIMGIVILFIALFLRIYATQRQRNLKKTGLVSHSTSAQKI
ncbi:adenosine 3'-phospho 5'-phosphosulfate transporter 1-like [Physella acuta]|uniref:adenosine 3'-phospho 5'-phosphosulfate transporter 1-like n=1 Tax=Physella acuta TaxID=109671 RepID=UPI0027DCA66F|nr:adenosine 3'-phospho 5'-phosphosulfate transporter 1-like [Physella acuta]XP_059157301.1 adenosine 3'-phospho 5'-phosphosulfate transporter 1-like [Physella acuta]XP_059157302.1 adenosine 3'-phospho 5'-phosphosulfate transporter 1-like [Physella acuta]XP_059157303.1 adenosine 3'-phospho 5'-phosphosulfate transporter 1-like [Physella acuta]XP_059157304.1 adenosine 3'-phospho 5'-phosphosulfate transporter 1-like [Physella acuta]XP_059157305.1 adenosine 3'-phospho 5'-phosphosulfate transporter